MNVCLKRKFSDMKGEVCKRDGSWLAAVALQRKAGPKRAYKLCFFPRFSSVTTPGQHGQPRQAAQMTTWGSRKGGHTESGEGAVPRAPLRVLTDPPPPPHTSTPPLPLQPWLNCASPVPARALWALALGFTLAAAGIACACVCSPNHRRPVGAFPFIIITLKTPSSRGEASLI